MDYLYPNAGPLKLRGARFFIEARDSDRRADSQERRADGVSGARHHRAVGEMEFSGTRTVAASSILRFVIRLRASDTDY